MQWILLSTLCVLSSLFPIRCYVPFGFYFFRPYVVSSLFPILCYVLTTFCPLIFFPDDLLSHSTFCPSAFLIIGFFSPTFYRWIDPSYEREYQKGIAQNQCCINCFTAFSFYPWVKCITTIGNPFMCRLTERVKTTSWRKIQHEYNSVLYFLWLIMKKK